MKSIIAILILCFAGNAWAADAAPSKDAAATSDAAVKAADSAPAIGAPGEPTTAEEAVEKGKEAITAAKTGQWWYFSSLVCLILMFVLKITKLLAKMGRWKYVVLPVLALASALLAAFQGGVSLNIAVGVFTTSWATGMLEELWSHGIMGKPHS